METKTTELEIQEAIKNIKEFCKASPSFLQRRMKLGYVRAYNLLEELEKRGIVGCFNGSKPREILI